MAAPLVLGGYYAAQGAMWGYRAYRGYRAARAASLAMARSKAARTAAKAAANAKAKEKEETCKDCDPACPVCGKKGGKAPEKEPDWSKHKNKPPANQTILGDKTKFKKMGGGKIHDGQPAYTSLETGQIHYIDAFHGKGQGHAEIEVFDKKGKEHLGTKCPACGADLGKQDKSKKLPKSLK